MAPTSPSIATHLFKTNRNPSTSTLPHPPSTLNSFSHLAFNQESSCSHRCARPTRFNLPLRQLSPSSLPAARIAHGVRGHGLGYGHGHLELGAKRRKASDRTTYVAATPNTSNPGPMTHWTRLTRAFTPYEGGMEDGGPAQESYSVMVPLSPHHHHHDHRGSTTAHYDPRTASPTLSRSRRHRTKPGTTGGHAASPSISACSTRFSISIASILNHVYCSCYIHLFLHRALQYAVRATWIDWPDSHNHHTLTGTSSFSSYLSSLGDQSSRCTHSPAHQLSALAGVAAVSPGCLALCP
ncbi:hypothetical protein EDB81DRAFT_106612 [Dactylonectria macrodidyma]|uniref:Uncharacterized protein n=1 Tax=Dactylonectria macrodidyma TaxID=307937 RepID=A0A9P9ISG5_9HYPO|nr:hypothetical protein EDB81DRAFT_106612 [Dactylonectria macrodidyma]